jgi:methyltransferase family protein
MRFARDLLTRVGLRRIGRSYPKSVYVAGANESTVSFVRSTTCTRIAEIGVFEGYTSLEFVRFLDGRGELHLFDFEDRVNAVVRRLNDQGFSNVRGFGCSHKLLDSYNWPLAALISEHTEPIYDYVFIDGAHTWAIDALAFFLVDRLLQPGGYVDFDDYDWSLRDSPSLNPEAFPLTKQLYSTDQIDACQIKMIVDLIVRRDRRYREVVRNKIFQKITD